MTEDRKNGTSKSPDDPDGDFDPRSADRRSVSSEPVEINETDMLDSSDSAGVDLAEDTGQIAVLRDQLQRSQAELINFRRRVARDREQVRQTSRAAMLRELLPAIDDFARALSPAAEESSFDAYREGLDLALHNLHEALRRVGVERLDALGSIFDPHLHEAIETVGTDDPQSDGRIVDVLQAGYRLDGQLLRPARVVVAQAPAAEPREPGDSGTGSTRFEVLADPESSLSDED